MARWQPASFLSNTATYQIHLTCLLLPTIAPSAALESTCCFQCCARSLLCHSIRSKPAQGCSEVVLPPECFFRVQELSNLASQWGIQLPVKARSNYIVQFFVLWQILPLCTAWLLEKHFSGLNCQRV